MKELIDKWLWRILKLLVLIFPKNKRLWVFGAWQGNLYGDNSKYVFEYVNRECPDIQAVWITGDDSVVWQVRKSGYRCYHRFSFKGMLSWMRAGVCFATEGNQDISPAIGMGKQKIIQLWHGMGIKAVGLESGWYKEQPAGEAQAQKQMFEKVYAKWYWMCASEEAKKKYSRSFAVPEEQFIITGQPKDDSFVNIKPNQEIEQIRQQFPGARIAVYLPTHRNFGKDSEISNVMSIESLRSANVKLKEKNIVMIFKPHFHEFAKYAGYEAEFSNIIFATDKQKYGDVYEFLPNCDLLITDYSGIMFGYLAANKPIIYFAYDYEAYVKDDAGFCYDYEDITYGPICRTWDEVIEHAAAMSSKDYAELRKKQCARFCPYDDGKSCERVYQQVLQLLKSDSK